jgi:hypothetical protein
MSNRKIRACRRSVGQSAGRTGSIASGQRHPWRSFSWLPVIPKKTTTQKLYLMLR